MGKKKTYEVFDRRAMRKYVRVGKAELLILADMLSTKYRAAVYIDYRSTIKEIIEDLEGIGCYVEVI